MPHPSASTFLSALRPAWCCLAILLLLVCFAGCREQTARNEGPFDEPAPAVETASPSPTSAPPDSDVLSRPKGDSPIPVSSPSSPVASRPFTGLSCRAPTGWSELSAAPSSIHFQNGNVTAIVSSAEASPDCNAEQVGLAVLDDLRAMSTEFTLHKSAEPVSIDGYTGQHRQATAVLAGSAIVVDLTIAQAGDVFCIVCLTAPIAQSADLARHRQQLCEQIHLSAAAPTAPN